jgi:hypothetical protein
MSLLLNTTPPPPKHVHAHVLFGQALKISVAAKSGSFSHKKFREKVPTNTTDVISNYDSSAFQKQHRLTCSAISPRRAKLAVASIIVDVLSIVFELTGTYSDVLHSQYAVTIHLYHVAVSSV